MVSVRHTQQLKCELNVTLLPLHARYALLLRTGTWKNEYMLTSYYGVESETNSLTGEKRVKHPVTMVYRLI